MNTKALLISIIAVALSFAGGFLLANALNRSEAETLRSENARLRSISEAGPETAGAELTSEEIEEKIAEADRNPGDVRFQKGLGLALYRYGAIKQDAELLKRSIRLLERALSLDASDLDVRAGLGNAYFDIGYFQKDNASLEKAREYYISALERQPENVDFRTDIGLTYFLQQPPDLSAAAEHFAESLKRDPNHEKTLQFSIQTFVKMDKFAEAEQSLEQLRKTRPNSPSVPELAALIESARSGK